ncbi:MAG: hypothetical protein QXU18_04065 [Thermoplasmatales archaeon]
MKDEETIQVWLTGRTLNRIKAILADDNFVDVNRLTVDDAINEALSWQQKKYERLKYELNTFQKRMLGLK